MTIEDQTQEPQQRCGYVAIVGRPNVGKSTLLNKILGQKISITCRKPQTTRHQIIGVKTEGDVQAVYVDTPGLHLNKEKALNRFMNKAASSALEGVDVVVFIIDRTAWTEEEDFVLDKIKRSGIPTILAINKVDWLEDKESLLPFMQEISQKHDFVEMIPISAKTGRQVDVLEEKVESFLPESIHFYPEDQLTDRSSRFLSAEIVREKVMRSLGEEVPYQMTVMVERFKVIKGRIHIDAVIYVEKQGQKLILIGNKGGRIKQIGIDARQDMERLFDNQVVLKLWVKVKSGWSDDERALQSLGYFDQLD
ncbi:GTPase Era [Litoribrevibacter albus]|uniref:GTPase Era n=1 Tax=Litoribrevibacter albus TaxID=1473156 RepID=A0AA37SAL0_9GAMM|nr:GTPase Era [Litoribrevibacter albus]GLQ31202.1 GTPase Era [Litoribrevibacter albus]